MEVLRNPQDAVFMEGAEQYAIIPAECENKTVICTVTLTAGEYELVVLPRHGWHAAGRLTLVY